MPAHELFAAETAALLACTDLLAGESRLTAADAVFAGFGSLRPGSSVAFIS